ncbi:hypothetical protein GA0115246_1144018 [Streptomyces sp. SolWspMP-sol7th]|nr:hypothetical protein GA0115246_1144018 [Streptomyces sp. SolWspMP-sol7th]
MFMRTKPYWTQFGVARGGSPTRRSTPRRGGIAPRAGHLTPLLPGGSGVSHRGTGRGPGKKERGTGRVAAGAGGAGDESSVLVVRGGEGRRGQGTGERTGGSSLLVRGRDSSRARGPFPREPFPREPLGAEPLRAGGAERPVRAGAARAGGGRGLAPGCWWGGVSLGACRTSTWPRPPRSIRSPGRRCSRPSTRAGPIRPGSTARDGGRGCSWTRPARRRPRRWAAARTNSSSRPRAPARSTPGSPGRSPAGGAWAGMSWSRRSSTPPYCTPPSRTRVRVVR